MRLIQLPKLALALLGGTLLVASLAAGCGNRGSVTFAISPPTNPLLDPITDRVSQYALLDEAATVVAVASENPQSPDVLPLGPLPQLTVPTDLVVHVLSGSELLGMARIRDVVILDGVEKQYTAEVRKPLITVGSAPPQEK